MHASTRICMQTDTVKRLEAQQLRSVFQVNMGGICSDVNGLEMNCVSLIQTAGLVVRVCVCVCVSKSVRSEMSIDFELMINN